MRVLRACFGVPGVLGLLALAGVYSCTDVSVTAIAVDRIEITPAETSLVPGGTMRLNVEITDSEGRPLPDREVVWESMDPEVATISPEGVVTAVGVGSATVRATSEGVTDSASVTVGLGPMIQVEEDALTLTGVAGSPSARTTVVNVSNSGGGVLDRLSTRILYGPSGSEWLTGTLSRTRAPADLVLSASARDLAAGAYTADVRVSSPAAANSPRTVRVQFNVAAGIGGTPPITPSNLDAEAASTSRIDLTWRDNSSNETGFEVERSTNAGTTWTSLLVLGANVTAYSNNGLADGSTYHYRVRATSSSTPSAFTSPSSATTPLEVPTGLTAAAVSSSRINLTWVDTSVSETGFAIQRRPGSGAFSTITTTAAGATSFPDTGLLAQTTYEYRVRTVNSAGTSAPSATASARTLGAAPSEGAPTATTQAASAVTMITATLNGSVNPNGAATSVRFEWSLFANFSVKTQTPAQDLPSGTSTVAVNAAIAGLLPGATYHFRIVATNSNGTTNGEILSFTTPLVSL